MKPGCIAPPCQPAPGPCSESSLTARPRRRDSSPRRKTTTRHATTARRCRLISDAILRRPISGADRDPRPTARARAVSKSCRAARQPACSARRHGFRSRHPASSSHHVRRNGARILQADIGARRPMPALLPWNAAPIADVTVRRQATGTRAPGLASRGLARPREKSPGTVRHSPTRTSCTRAIS